MQGSDGGCYLYCRLHYVFYTKANFACIRNRTLIYILTCITFTFYVFNVLYMKVVQAKNLAYVENRVTKT
jgi:hypothetical protein